MGKVRAHDETATWAKCARTMKRAHAEYFAIACAYDETPTLFIVKHLHVFDMAFDLRY